MIRPIIFFSHSSRDAALLRSLTASFDAKTGGSFEVFLSSDGQSIPLGRNWVHRVEEALTQARLMVVFLTPNAIASQWIYFESGFAYSKGIRVVPVGILGVDLGTLSPPMSLLQGFNVRSADGLNNLIALANEVFGHKHALGFTPNEYANLIGGAAGTAASALGEYASAVRDVSLSLGKAELAGQDPVQVLQVIGKVVDDLGLECHRSGTRLQIHGMDLFAVQEPAGLRVHIEPMSFNGALTLLPKFMSAARPDGMQGIVLHIDFESFIECISATHRISGRLQDVGVHLSGRKDFSLGSIEFQLDNPVRILGHGAETQPPRLSLRFIDDLVSFGDISRLVSILFDRGLLFATTSMS